MNSGGERDDDVLAACMQRVVLALLQHQAIMFVSLYAAFDAVVIRRHYNVRWAVPSLSMLRTLPHSNTD